MHHISTLITLVACIGIAFSSPFPLPTQVTLSKPAANTKSATAASLPSSVVTTQLLLPQNSLSSSILGDIAKWNSEVEEVKEKTRSLDDDIDAWNGDISTDDYAINFQEAVNAARSKKERTKKSPLPVFRLINQHD